MKGDDGVLGCESRVSGLPARVLIIIITFMDVFFLALMFFCAIFRLSKGVFFFVCIDANKAGVTYIDWRRKEKKNPPDFNLVPIWILFCQSLILSKLIIESSITK